MTARSVTVSLFPRGQKAQEGGSSTGEDAHAKVRPAGVTTQVRKESSVVPNVSHEIIMCRSSEKLSHEKPLSEAGSDSA